MASNLTDEIIEEILSSIEFEDQVHWTYLKRTLTTMVYQTNIEIVDHRRDWLYMVDFVRRALVQLSLLVEEDVLLPLRVLLIRRNGFESAAFKQLLEDYYKVRHIKLVISMHYDTHQIPIDQKFDLAFVVEEKGTLTVNYINEIYKKCNSVVTIVHV